MATTRFSKQLNITNFRSWKLTLHEQNRDAILEDEHGDSSDAKTDTAENFDINQQVICWKRRWWKKKRKFVAYKENNKEKKKYKKNEKP